MEILVAVILVATIVTVALRLAMKEATVDQRRRAKQDGDS